jgi:DNA-binding NarL/FixJ family response regulator
LKKIRLLIIEDNKLQREGLAAMLKEEDDIQVVGALGEKVQVMDKVHDLRPDVMLLDIGLPNYNIVKLVAAIKKKFPWTKVVIMGLIPVQAEINHYANAGVTGFILKDAATGEFLETIRQVAAGENVLPKIAGESVFSKIVDDEVKELKESKLIQSLSMTEQEKAVLRLVAAGMTDNDIAAKLAISNHAVRGHVDNILEKMALNTRVQIALYINSEEANPDNKDSGK